MDDLAAQEEQGDRRQEGREQVVMVRERTSLTLMLMSSGSLPWCLAISLIRSKMTTVSFREKPARVRRAVMISRVISIFIR